MPQQTHTFPPWRPIDFNNAKTWPVALLNRLTKKWRGQRIELIYTTESLKCPVHGDFIGRFPADVGQTQCEFPRRRRGPKKGMVLQAPRQEARVRGEVRLELVQG